MRTGGLQKRGPLFEIFCYGRSHFIWRLTWWWSGTETVLQTGICMVFAKTWKYSSLHIYRYFLFCCYLCKKTLILNFFSLFLDDWIFSMKMRMICEWSCLKVSGFYCKWKILEKWIAVPSVERFLFAAQICSLGVWVPNQPIFRQVHEIVAEILKMPRHFIFSIWLS